MINFIIGFGVGLFLSLITSLVLSYREVFGENEWDGTVFDHENP